MELPEFRAASGPQGESDYQEPPDQEETPALRFVLSIAVIRRLLFEVFLFVFSFPRLLMSLSMLMQGIAGAEGSPGKDGLVGERVRSNQWFVCCCCFKCCAYSRVY